MTRSSIFTLCAVLAAGCARDASTANRGVEGPANKTTTGTAKTIVLVHGAFADGSSWDRVVPILEGNGYNVVAVHQPLTSLADARHAQTGFEALDGSMARCLADPAPQFRKVIDPYQVRPVRPDRSRPVGGTVRQKPGARSSQAEPGGA